MDQWSYIPHTHLNWGGWCSRQLGWVLCRVFLPMSIASMCNIQVKFIRVNQSFVLRFFGGSDSGLIKLGLSHVGSIKHRWCMWRRRRFLGFNCMHSAEVTTSDLPNHMLGFFGWTDRLIVKVELHNLWGTSQGRSWKIRTRNLNHWVDAILGLLCRSLKVFIYDLQKFQLHKCFNLLQSSRGARNDSLQRFCARSREVWGRAIFFPRVGG